MQSEENDADPLEKKYSNNAVILRLLKLIWGFRWDCIVVLFLQIVLLIIGLSGLSLVGLGIDVIRHAHNPALVQPAEWPFQWIPPEAWTGIQLVLLVAGGILALAILRLSLNYALILKIQRLIQGKFVPRMRDELFTKLHALSFSFFDKNSSGSIINRLTSDVQMVRMFVDGVVIQAIIMVISLAVYLVYMTNIHVLLTLACLAPVPLMWFLSIIFSKTSRPLYTENMKLMDRLILQLVESIQGIQTIKGFSREDHAKALFEEKNLRVMEHRRKIFRLVSFFQPGIHFLTDLSVFIALLYGGYLVVQGDIAVGTGLVVFTGLLTQMSAQLTNLSTLVDNAQQSLTAARRVFEIVDESVSVVSPEAPQALEKVHGKIEFHNVSFRYTPTNSVLNKIHFSAKPGQMIAIVGATGAGKSALLSLIPRFYDPSEGSVSLDGRDLRTIDLNELRHHIGIVFQESFLFSNSIAANICFGQPDASREQIEKAAQIACAHDFIMEMEKGYDTILAETGTNLSGGQRQRLAIARAILWNPEILILDDPTAAIDPETEHEILEAIDRAVSGRTTFIVATRLSTLMRADRILVLEKGRLIQDGTHEELMQEDALYRNAASLQMVDSASMNLLRQSLMEEKGEG